MSAENPVNHQPVPYRDDDEIDLLDLLIVFARNKFFIIGAALLFALAAVGATFFMTPAYKATAKFIPIRSDSPIAVGVIADIVKSRSLLGDVALQIKLDEIWSEATPSQLSKSLGDAIIFESPRDSASMSVSAQLPDPTLAAEAANTIVAETEKRLFKLHEEQMQFVRKRKTSLEQELRNAQKELNNAEETLMKTIAGYKISPDAMRELTDISLNSSEAGASILQQLPDGGAAYLEGLRSLKTRETFYFSLISQYSKVLEQEKVEPITLQILEKASIPEQRSRPRKTLIVLMSGFLGGFIGIFGAFIREFARNAKRDPERKAKLEELSAAMRIFGKGKE